MCVFSGTPMINDPYETAQLFNLLRGYTLNIHSQLKQLEPKVRHFKHLEKIVESHVLVNQYIVRQRDNQIIVTQNPWFC